MEVNNDDALLCPAPPLAPSPPYTPDRNAIRREMRCRRRALSRAERSQSAQMLARRLGNSTLFLRSEHIAFYLANDGEMDLRPLIERAWAMGKQCYLPVLSPAFHNRLWFAPYQPDTPLRDNQFRILEPALPWHAVRPAMAIDLMLTPLVAFDATGNRLGMGGGFYDRTLAYLQYRRYWRKPLLIGTAYEFQKVAMLPHAAWDVPLHGVATEQALYHFATGQ